MPTMDQTSRTTKSLRGRNVLQVDYKKIADMDGAVGEEQDCKSVTSRKSRKSHKSTRSVKPDAGKVRKKSETVEQSDLDSRAGDFDYERALEDTGDHDEVLSMGSDAERFKKLQEQLEISKPSLGEKYSELKVQEGTQQRLEDMEILDGIVDNECFEQIKKHLEQAQATEERQLRVMRALEIFGIREQIIEKRMNARRLEWELQVKERQAEVKRNQWVLDKKKQEYTMQKLQQQEDSQWEEFEILTVETEKIQ